MISINDFLPITIGGVLDKIKVIDIGNDVYKEYNKDFYRFSKFIKSQKDLDIGLKIPVAVNTTFGFTYDGNKVFSIKFGNTINTKAICRSISADITYWDYTSGRSVTVGFGGIYFPLDDDNIYLYVGRLSKDLVKDSEKYAQFSNWEWGAMYFCYATYINISGVGFQYCITTIYGSLMYEERYNRMVSEFKIADGTVEKGEIPIDDNGDQDGGGNGSGDIGNEPIDDEEPPESFVTNSNLLTIYNVGSAALIAISDFLNSGDFLDLWKHKSDIMNSIISFHSVPISESKLNTSTTTFKIGGISPSDIAGATDITIRKATKQYYDVDLGSIEIPEIVGGFMDYQPYIKLSVYLPFIGIVNLNVNDFMNDMIKLKYTIDILTGDAMAKISNSKTIIATFNGNVAIKYPLVAVDHSNIYAQALRTVETVFQTGMTGGASIGNTVQNLTSLSVSKPNYKYSGNVAGNMGILGNMQPYIIIRKPVLSYPKKYASYYGYMSNITAVLGTLKGYTKVKEIHLDGLQCLESERLELEELLKNGVIL